MQLALWKLYICVPCTPTQLSASIMGARHSCLLFIAVCLWLCTVINTASYSPLPIFPQPSVFLKSALHAPCVLNVLVIWLDVKRNGRVRMQLFCNSCGRNSKTSATTPDLSSSRTPRTWTPSCRLTVFYSTKWPTLTSPKRERTAWRVKTERYVSLLWLAEAL